jgi:tetratricopeptide (TPR) repeat protein
VAVVVVLGVLAWSELPRKTSEPPSPAAQPAQMPPAADLAPLEREVAENPGDVHAKLRLANALQDNGAYSRAIELYKDYLGVHAEDPDARVDLGICYFELARTDSTHSGAFLDLAIKEMTTAFEGTQQHQPAAFNLGIVYLTAGNLEESTRWFERAAALDSSSALGRRSRQLLEQHRMMSQ